MQDVSDKLLGQFVACLEQRLAAPEAPEVAGVSEVGEVSEALAAPETPKAPPPPPAPGAAAPTPAPQVAQPPPRPASAPREPEALDLGSAVLPVLARTYWRPALAGLVLVVLLWRLLRRR
jgi:hypothetical protein